MFIYKNVYTLVVRINFFVLQIRKIGGGGFGKIFFTISNTLIAFKCQNDDFKQCYNNGCSTLPA